MFLQYILLLNKYVKSSLKLNISGLFIPTKWVHSGGRLDGLTSISAYTSEKVRLVVKKTNYVQQIKCFNKLSYNNDINMQYNKTKQNTVKIISTI